MQLTSSTFTSFNLIVMRLSIMTKSPRKAFSFILLKLQKFLFDLTRLHVITAIIFNINQPYSH